MAAAGPFGAVTAEAARTGCPSAPDARHVAPWGTDRGPGTAGSPWRTLRRAERSSRPGRTVVIHPGRYNAVGSILELRRSGRKGRPIAWVGARGPRPVIRGHVSVDGDRRRLCGLSFAGRTGPVSNTGEELDKLAIRGNHVVLSRSEVTGSRWHSGVYLERAWGTKLVKNHIHHNGRFGDPAHANLDHGIYWASGSGLVARNRIERNVAHAVQLYPYARKVTVRANRMTRHGRAAVMLGEAAAGNVISGNYIHGNRRGVQAYALFGRGNVVRGNALWDNPEGDLVDLDGVTVAANR